MKFEIHSIPLGQSQCIIRASTSPKHYSQYSSMLPPPPLPPMARPVAIIRSTGDLSIINSPPPSITPPSVNNMHSPHHSDHNNITDTTEIGNTSPPMSPHDGHQQHRKSSVSSLVSQQPHSRLASSYASAAVNTGREYSFNPFHSTSGQVYYIRPVSASSIRRAYEKLSAYSFFFQSISVVQLLEHTIEYVGCDKSDQSEFVFSSDDVCASHYFTYTLEYFVHIGRRFQHDHAASVGHAEPQY